MDGRQRSAPAAPSVNCKNVDTNVKFMCLIIKYFDSIITEVLIVVVTNAYEVGMVIVEVLVLVDENRKKKRGAR